MAKCYWIKSRTGLGELIAVRKSEKYRVLYLLRSGITAYKPDVLREATPKEVEDYRAKYLLHKRARLIKG